MHSWPFACARDREAPVGAEERFQSGAEIVVVFGDEDPVGAVRGQAPHASRGRPESPPREKNLSGGDSERP